jgi:hypothetical protein
MDGLKEWRNQNLFREFQAVQYVKTLPLKLKMSLGSETNNLII